MEELGMRIINMAYEVEAAVVQTARIAMIECNVISREDYKNSIDIQSTPLNRNLVNWEFRKWVGCEHLTPTSQFTLYIQLCSSGMYNVNCEVGVKCSQPAHFLNSQLTRFRLSGVDCIWGETCKISKLIYSLNLFWMI